MVSSLAAMVWGPSSRARRSTTTSSTCARSRAISPRSARTWPHGSCAATRRSRIAGVPGGSGGGGGALSFLSERLGLVDGEPVSFQASYLPAAIGEEVSKADLAVTPLRQVLSFKLGVEITGAQETVYAG